MQQRKSHPDSYKLMRVRSGPALQKSNASHLSDLGSASCPVPYQEVNMANSKESFFDVIGRNRELRNACAGVLIALATAVAKGTFGSSGSD